MWFQGTQVMIISFYVHLYADDIDSINEKNNLFTLQAWSGDKDWNIYDEAQYENTYKTVKVIILDSKTSKTEYLDGITLVSRTALRNFSWSLALLSKSKNLFLTKIESKLTELFYLEK